MTFRLNILVYIILLTPTFLLAQSNGYIVQFDKIPSPEVVKKLESRGILLNKKIFEKPLMYLIKSGRGLEINISELSKIPGIIHVNANRPAELRTTEPNDALFHDMWHLDQIHACGAWDFATSGTTNDNDSIVIAVFDSGFEQDHPDLKYNLWKNKSEIPNDGIDNDGNSYIDDYNGLNIYSGKDDHAQKPHGTEVIGVVGASGNNEIGISGVTWNAKLMMVSKSQGGLFEADFIEAYNYIIDQRKTYNESDGNLGSFVVAVNLSIGISRAKAEDYPMWCAVYDELGRHGILGISATDNDNYNVDIEGDMPTTCPSPYQIAVTGSTRSDQLMNFVAYGPTHIDLTAPGDEIITTTLGHNYGDASGTSLATPQVSGAIGLLYMAASADLLAIINSNPAHGALIMRELLLSNVEQSIDLQDMVASGGRLDLESAVRAARNYTSDPAPEELTIGEFYPTLTNSMINLEIQLPVDEPVEFYIYDMHMGRLVRQFTETNRFSIGSNFYSFSVANLGSGSYFLVIEQGNNKLTRKFVKINSGN